MTRVVVDQRTRTQLNNLKETLQFVDEAGEVLGIFTPSANAALLKPQITDEEIQRRLSQGTGRPLADILRDLQKQA